MPRKKPLENQSVPSVARHASSCRICKHPEREQIERDFVAWESPEDIVAEYKIPNRASVYRHAHAFGLFPKRGRNLCASLDRIIEQAGKVEVTAGAVVQAIALRARINSQGQLIRQREEVSLHEVFAQMTAEELEAYAANGTVPARLADYLPATIIRGEEDENEG